MMTFDDPIFLMMLLVANAALVAAAVLVILRFQRHVRRAEEFWNSPTGVAVAEAGTRGERPAAPRDPLLERRVAELQSVVRTLAKASTQSVPRRAPSLPLDNAVRMAKRGASVEQLMNTCGLNVGEARLLQKLHSSHGRASAAA